MSLDLTHRCAVCDCDLGPGRSDRRFCSTVCANRYFTQLEAEARREALAGRVCAACGGPISPDKRKDARFCSKTCLHGNHNPARWPKAKRICAACGDAFQPLQRPQRFCSKACSRALRSRNALGQFIPAKKR